MLIDTFSLTEQSDTVLLLTWTATDLSKTCYVFRNGQLITSISDSTGLSRSYLVDLDDNDLHVIEIHELTETEVDGIHYAKDTNVVRWDREDEALYYLVYHSEEHGAETLLDRVNQVPERPVYYWTTPDLNWTNGVWHHFRVESVDAWNNQSTRVLWHFFLYGMPVDPDVQITGSAGTFTLTLTP